VSSKRVETVLLCEDSQHEAFVRRLVENIAPAGTRPRVEKGPKGRGAGDNWVIRRFPAELAALRRAHRSARLVVMVDGDGHSPQERRAEIDDACRSAGVKPPTADEPVLVLVPCRNIESWLAYLRGERVDEGTKYPRLRGREAECKPQVAALAEMCRSRQLRPPAPPSLEAACSDYRELQKLSRR
jgi:hypothetical protein